MTYGTGLALLTLILAPSSGNTQDGAPHTSCPLPTPTPPVDYTRLHQIPTAASNNDVSQTIVTPGGMVLHAPKMVAATDFLTVVARNPDIHLVTVGKDWNKCEIEGLASKEPQGSYLFHEGSVAVRFTFVGDGDGQVNVAPIGTTYRSRCESSGSIDRAIYTLNVQSN